MRASEQGGHRIRRKLAGRVSKHVGRTNNRPKRRVHRSHVDKLLKNIFSSPQKMTITQTEMEKKNPDVEFV